MSHLQVAPRFNRFERFTISSLRLCRRSLTGWCYQQIDKPREALEWYQRSLTLEPDQQELRIACSQILAELGCNEEAAKYLEDIEATALQPNERRILQSLICKARGDLKGAIEGLKSVLTETNSNWASSLLFQKEHVYRILSKFQRECGDSESALLSLESAVRIYPGDLWLMNDTAFEYADQAIRMEEALMLINRALEHQPDNPLFLDTKGWILFKMGQSMEARAELERSLELLPNYGQAEEHYTTVVDSIKSQ